MTPADAGKMSPPGAESRWAVRLPSRTPMLPIAREKVTGRVAPAG